MSVYCVEIIEILYSKNINMNYDNYDRQAEAVVMQRQQEGYSSYAFCDTEPIPCRCPAEFNPPPLLRNQSQNKPQFALGV